MTSDKEIVDNYGIMDSESDGNTSFLRAARNGQLEKVLEYLKTNIDINTSNANGLNALHLASKDGHVEIVEELLKRGAIVDAATKKGNTALHIASLAGQEEVVKLLVQHGASVNVQSQNGFTPLYMAAQENHDNVVKFLLANGANQSLSTEDGFTPLAVAMQQGHDKVVTVLLENDTRGKVRLPALHIAAKKDDVRAAKLLLENDHNPDVTSKSGFTPLHIASHYGNQPIANLLIQKGADVNYSAKHNITPLHVAAKWGKSNMVSLLLEQGAHIEAKTRDGLTPLHCAARSGHEQVVDMLLEKSAPISSKTKNGLAPLHMAAQGDHVDAARILLHHRAPVDEVTVDYLTALHVAAHCGHVRVAKLLLERQADANARALNGFTPLHIACKKNRIKVVELLLKHGACIGATTESGLTPLHVASFMGCMNIVIYLLQHDASPDIPTVRGETPLHLAARANQTDIIRILLRNGAQVDARAREQQTPLHVASRLGNVDIVMLLLQHGAKIDNTTKDMYTALHIAAKEGQDEVAAVLIENGASLNSTTKKGFTPLHLAAKYGHLKVAKLLVQKEAPVDAQGKNGVTPLHVASHYDNQNVALLLLEKGASPHAEAKNGHTPLHIAARKNQMDIAHTLLEYGAKPDVESKAGFTPLHLSSQDGHVEISSLLLEHKATPDYQSKNGLTPMHLCAQENRVAVAELLHKNGANIDSQTKGGYTPLHIASHYGQADMVKFLLSKGADVKATTSLGYTPLHQAAQQGHTNIVNILLENSAHPNAITNNGQTPLHIAQKLGYITVIDTLKKVTESPQSPALSEEKYRVVAPELMHETFLSDSEEEGEDTLLGDQTYRYLTADEMKSLGDDSLPIDVTRDERVDSNRMVGNDDPNAYPPRHIEDSISPEHIHPNYVEYIKKATDNVDISRHPVNIGFLVSFLVDARGGAMRGCRHSGVRVIVPPRCAPSPTRITCRYVRPQRTPHPPPLMEGEALASRVLELGPVGAKFLGPVIIEVPHFAALRGKEREIVIFRSDNGESWKEHTVEATEDILNEVLRDSFDTEDLNQMEDHSGGRTTRIITQDFPQYFAVISRIRQEVHAIGPEGGMVSSTVVPQVQAVFPQGALTKKIKVGLQAQPIDPELTAKLLGHGVAVSPVVTVEPRRRKFHKAITLSMPAPRAHSQGMINQYSGSAPTLRLLCSITGGTSRAQWEDVTGSTPLTFVNDCVSFTTTVSARFWLMDCRNIGDATKMATELYREAIHVPFIAKFVVFAKRIDPLEARLRVFCMTDDKEEKTLEYQEQFTEIAKSRDVEVMEGKSQYIEFAGNLVPITKSGEQLQFSFRAFKENRLPFSVRVKDQHAEAVSRCLFMREPKVQKGEPPQQPICILNIVLPDDIVSETISLTDSESISKKYYANENFDYYRQDPRLADISNLLGDDWVELANQLGLTSSEINVIKSEYPDSVAKQAQSMLRMWLSQSGNRVQTNTLENALCRIGREDIANQCLNVDNRSREILRIRSEEKERHRLISDNRNDNITTQEKYSREEKLSKKVPPIDKYSAEEKTFEPSDEEEEEEDFNKTVPERREQIVKRLSTERTIPASSQRVEIVQEITSIKRQSLVEDKIAEVQQKANIEPMRMNTIKPVSKIIQEKNLSEKKEQKIEEKSDESAKTLIDAQNTEKRDDISTSNLDNQEKPDRRDSVLLEEVTQLLETKKPVVKLTNQNDPNSPKFSKTPPPSPADFIKEKQATTNQEWNATGDIEKLSRLQQECMKDDISGKTTSTKYSIKLNNELIEKNVDPPAVAFPENSVFFSEKLSTNGSGAHHGVSELPSSEANECEDAHQTDLKAEAPASSIQENERCQNFSACDELQECSSTAQFRKLTDEFLATEVRKFHDVWCIESLDARNNQNNSEIKVLRKYPVQQLESKQDSCFGEKSHDKTKSDKITNTAVTEAEWSPAHIQKYTGEFLNEEIKNFHDVKCIESTLAHSHDPGVYNDEYTEKNIVVDKTDEMNKKKVTEVAQDDQKLSKKNKKSGFLGLFGLKSKKSSQTENNQMEEPSSDKNDSKKNQKKRKTIKSNGSVEDERDSNITLISATDSEQQQIRNPELVMTSNTETIQNQKYKHENIPKKILDATNNFLTTEVKNYYDVKSDMMSYEYKGRKYPALQIVDNQDTADHTRHEYEHVERRLNVEKEGFDQKQDILIGKMTGKSESKTEENVETEASVDDSINVENNELIPHATAVGHQQGVAKFIGESNEDTETELIMTSRDVIDITNKFVNTEIKDYHDVKCTKDEIPKKKNIALSHQDGSKISGFTHEQFDEIKDSSKKGEKSGLFSLLKSKSKREDSSGIESKDDAINDKNKKENWNESELPSKRGDEAENGFLMSLEQAIDASNEFLTNEMNNYHDASCKKIASLKSKSEENKKPSIDNIKMIDNEHKHEQNNDGEISRTSNESAINRNSDLDGKNNECNRLETETKLILSSRQKIDTSNNFLTNEIKKYHYVISNKLESSKTESDKYGNKNYTTYQDSGNTKHSERKYEEFDETNSVNDGKSKQDNETRIIEKTGKSGLFSFLKKKSKRAGSMEKKSTHDANNDRNIEDNPNEVEMKTETQEKLPELINSKNIDVETEFTMSTRQAIDISNDFLTTEINNYNDEDWNKIHAMKSECEKEKDKTLRDPPKVNISDDTHKNDLEDGNNLKNEQKVKTPGEKATSKKTGLFSFLKNKSKQGESVEKKSQDEASRKEDDNKNKTKMEARNQEGLPTLRSESNENSIKQYIMSSRQAIDNSHDFLSGEIRNYHDVKLNNFKTPNSASNEREKEIINTTLPNSNNTDMNEKQYKEVKNMEKIEKPKQVKKDIDIEETEKPRILNFSQNKSSCEDFTETDSTHDDMMKSGNETEMEVKHKENDPKLISENTEEEFTINVKEGMVIPKEFLNHEIEKYHDGQYKNIELLTTEFLRHKNDEDETQQNLDIKIIDGSSEHIYEGTHGNISDNEESSKTPKQKGKSKKPEKSGIFSFFKSKPKREGGIDSKLCDDDVFDKGNKDDNPSEMIHQAEITKSISSENKNDKIKFLSSPKQAIEISNEFVEEEIKNYDDTKCNQIESLKSGTEECPKSMALSFSEKEYLKQPKSFREWTPTEDSRQDLGNLESKKNNVVNSYHDVVLSETKPESELNNGKEKRDESDNQQISKMASFTFLLNEKQKYDDGICENIYVQKNARNIELFSSEDYEPRNFNEKGLLKCERTLEESSEFEPLSEFGGNTSNNEMYSNVGYYLKERLDNKTENFMNDQKGKGHKIGMEEEPYRTNPNLSESNEDNQEIFENELKSQKVDLGLEESNSAGTINKEREEIRETSKTFDQTSRDIQQRVISDSINRDEITEKVSNDDFVYKEQQLTITRTFLDGEKNYECFAPKGNFTSISRSTNSNVVDSNNVESKEDAILQKKIEITTDFLRTEKQNYDPKEQNNEIKKEVKIVEEDELRNTPKELVEEILPCERIVATQESKRQSEIPELSPEKEKLSKKNNSSISAHARSKTGKKKGILGFLKKKSKDDEEIDPKIKSSQNGKQKNCEKESPEETTTVEEQLSPSGENEQKSDKAESKESSKGFLGFLFKKKKPKNQDETPTYHRSEDHLKILQDTKSFLHKETEMYQDQRDFLVQDSSNIQNIEDKKTQLNENIVPEEDVDAVMLSNKSYDQIDEEKYIDDEKINSEYTGIDFIKEELETFEKSKLPSTSRVDSSIVIETQVESIEGDFPKDIITKNIFITETLVEREGNSGDQSISSDILKRIMDAKNDLKTQLHADEKCVYAEEPVFQTSAIYQYSKNNDETFESDFSPKSTGNSSGKTGKFHETQQDELVEGIANVELAKSNIVEDVSLLERSFHISKERQQEIVTDLDDLTSDEHSSLDSRHIEEIEKIAREAYAKYSDEHIPSIEQNTGQTISREKPNLICDRANDDCNTKTHKVGNITKINGNEDVLNDVIYASEDFVPDLMLSYSQGINQENNDITTKNEVICGNQEIDSNDGKRKPLFRIESEEENIMTVVDVDPVSAQSNELDELLRQLRMDDTKSTKKITENKIHIEDDKQVAEKIDIETIEKKLSDLGKALDDLEMLDETVPSEKNAEKERKLRRIERKFERMASEIGDNAVELTKSAKSEQYQQLVSQLSQEEVMSFQGDYNNLWDEYTFSKTDEWDSKTPDSQADVLELPQGETSHHHETTDTTGLKDRTATSLERDDSETRQQPADQHQLSNEMKELLREMEETSKK